MQFVLAQMYSMSWRHSEMVPIDEQGLKPPFPLEQFSVSLSSSRSGSRSGRCSPGAKGRLMFENSFCKQNACKLIFVTDSDTAEQVRVHPILPLPDSLSQPPTTFMSLNKKGETSYILLLYFCVYVLLGIFFLFYKPKHPNNILKLQWFLHYHNTEDPVAAASSISRGSA